MSLEQEQYEAVKSYFLSQQLSHHSLEDDLVDHCCSGIEELMEDRGHDFDMAFALMRQRLVPNGAREIEEDLKYLENYKPQRTMKKFVFASGYVSALCMLAGLVLIAMSLFQKQNLKMDQEQLRMEMVVFAGGYDADAETTRATRRQMNQAQAAENLNAIQGIRGLFVLGQYMLLMSVVLFAVTLLPYKFYMRYQRSQVEYANP